MEYHTHIVDAMGDTPMIELGLSDRHDPLILAKVEYLNPGGSVKDRIGEQMIDAAEREGELEPGDTIVEPTSGNTGIGLALAANKRGYNLHVTMPDKMSEEKAALLEALGAEVHWCPTDVDPDDPRSYYSVAERLVEEIDDAYMPNQYENPANPRAHYETTGPEIWEQTDGEITHFIAGMGTGGTITGVGQYLKEQNHDIQVIGVDPEGSIYSDEFYGREHEAEQYKTEGIGEDIIPDTIDLDLIDDIVQTTDSESFDHTRQLADEDGLIVGSSAGAAVAATEQYVVQNDLTEDSVVVTLLPDTGRNYSLDDIHG